MTQHSQLSRRRVIKTVGLGLLALGAGSGAASAAESRSPAVAPGTGATEEYYRPYWRGYGYRGYGYRPYGYRGYYRPYYRGYYRPYYRGYYGYGPYYGGISVRARGGRVRVRYY
ncbi:hypothetical protein [Haloarchaeobius sp. DFWS5]|uniref:hypothetical protein n=1 Tax=Haloarchaeobius sp. DFWS5 TaxID=3446114 RepID=UPI003EB70411